MYELYFCHFLYFCGTLNNNELKRIARIARRDYNNHRLNGWELDREVTLIFHSSLFTCEATAHGKRHPKVHLRLLQAHRLRRQRKADRKQLAAARGGYGKAGKRHEPHGRTNPTRLPALSGKFKITNSSFGSSTSSVDRRRQKETKGDRRR